MINVLSINPMFKLSNVSIGSTLSASIKGVEMIQCEYWINVVSINQRRKWSNVGIGSTLSALIKGVNDQMWVLDQRC